MASTTTNKGFPYPEGSDEPNIPADIQALAEAVDLEITGLALEELSNVNIASVANNDSLKYDSTLGVWKNVAAYADEDITELSLLEDVVLTNIQDNEVLVWDTSTSKWINTSISAAVPVTLDDLTDVSAPNPDNGQVLKYVVDGEVGGWVPATVSGTSSDSFTTINVSGQSSVYATSPTSQLNIASSGSVSISTDSLTNTITISATDSNTTYTAGTGLTLNGTEFSVTVDTYQPLDADLTAIAGLAGTSGLLKKTSANAWTLDTNTYLTSYTETDPVFTASAASGITSTNIDNWNTAYGWGNPAVQTINAQTGTTYTVQDSDLGKLITLSNSSAITVTVSATGLSNGSRIDLVQLGSGQVSISPSGVISNGNKYKLNGQYAVASLIKTASGWLLVGNTAA